MLIGPTCHANGIRGYGDPSHGVFLIGHAPGRDEYKTGRPMTGASGKLTDNILRACGWDRSKCYATNLVCTENTEPTLDEIMACRPRLLDEVRSHNAKLLVLLGSTVGELFFPTRKFGTVRGVIDYYAPWNVHILPTYHPAAILHSSAKRVFNERINRDIVRDFSKIAQFFDTPPRPYVSYHVVQDLTHAQYVFNNLKGYEGYVAIDVETHLDKDMDENVPVEEQCVCFSVSVGDETWWMPGEFLTQLKWPLDLQWTFHHGMFDTIALAEAIGVMLPIKHDTMYMSYALDERGGYHKLKTLARENEASGWYEEHPTAKKWNEKLADLPWTQRYNASDAAYTVRLADRLYKKMQADTVVPFERGHVTGSLLDVYNRLLIPGANIYRLMQQRGVYIDIERYHTLLKEYVPMRDEREAQLRELTASLGGKHYMNYDSPKQLGEFLYGTLRLPGGPSTAAPVLEALEGVEGAGGEFIDALIDFRHLQKAINTYLVGAWDDIRRTRRIHPHPGLHAQVTGRVSYSPYAVNTLPRETNDNPYLSRIRWMFTAPDSDWTLLVLDYRQAEIWNAWLYCQDAAMLADLQSGDFHTRSACNVFQIQPHEITPEKRSSSKKVTFGQFFGIGDVKLAKDMTNENKRLGIDRSYTPGEANAMQQNWRHRYPGYTRYKTSVVEEAVRTGELTTITGRKRRFPIVLDTAFVNQAINYKIQATSHDYVLASLIEMFPQVLDMGGFPIIDGHDAIVIEVPKSAVDEIGAYACSVMQTPRFGVSLSVPAEVKTGYSLGEVK